MASEVDVTVRAMYYVFLHGHPWKDSWHATDQAAWKLLRSVTMDTYQKYGWATAGTEHGGLHHRDKIITYLLTELEQ